MMTRQVLGPFLPPTAWAVSTFNFIPCQDNSTKPSWYLWEQNIWFSDMTNSRAAPYQLQVDPCIDQRFPAALAIAGSPGMTMRCEWLMLFIQTCKSLISTNPVPPPLTKSTRQKIIVKIFTQLSPVHGSQLQLHYPIAVDIVDPRASADLRHLENKKARSQQMKCGTSVWDHHQCHINGNSVLNCSPKRNCRGKKNDVQTPTSRASLSLRNGTSSLDLICFTTSWIPCLHIQRVKLALSHTSPWRQGFWELQKGGVNRWEKCRTSYLFAKWALLSMISLDTNFKRYHWVSLMSFFLSCIMLSGSPSTLHSCFSFDFQAVHLQPNSFATESLMFFSIFTTVSLKQRCVPSDPKKYNVAMQRWRSCDGQESCFILESLKLKRTWMVLACMSHCDVKKSSGGDAE